MLELEEKKLEDVKKVLMNIRKSPGAEGVTSSMLLSKEGLPIVSALPQGIEEAEMSAVGASILGAADLAAERAEQGALMEVLIKNEDGQILLTNCGESAILMVWADKETKPGSLIFASRRAAQEVKKILWPNEEP